MQIKTEKIVIANHRLLENQFLITWGTRTWETNGAVVATSVATVKLNIDASATNNVNFDSIFVGNLHQCVSKCCLSRVWSPTTHKNFAILLLIDIILIKSAWDKDIARSLKMIVNWSKWLGQRNDNYCVWGRVLMLLLKLCLGWHNYYLSADSEFRPLRGLASRQIFAIYNFIWHRRLYNLYNEIRRFRKYTGPG